MRRTVSTDMHSVDIRVAVNKKGLTLTSLSLRAGLPEYACRHALCGKNRRGEEAIANLLGIPAERIWPSRFLKPRRELSATSETSSRCFKPRARGV